MLEATCQEWQRRNTESLLVSDDLLNQQALDYLTTLFFYVLETYMYIYIYNLI